MSKAKEDRDDFIDLTIRVDGNDENRLIEIKEKIENNYKTKSKNKYLDFINNALKDYDLRYRTVFGDEYETREQSDIIKDNLKKAVEIKQSINFDSLDDIKEASKKTDNEDIAENIKNKYKSMYNECIEKWEETNNALSLSYSNRTEQTELLYKLMNLHDDCEYMGIKNHEFEEFYENKRNELLTVKDETLDTISDANKRYYKLLFKAQSYKTNVAEK